MAEAVATENRSACEIIRQEFRNEVLSCAEYTSQLALVAALAQESLAKSFAKKKFMAMLWDTIPDLLCFVKACAICKKYPQYQQVPFVRLSNVVLQMANPDK